MLSEFDTAAAVARGLRLLSADQVPDPERSHLQADGYALVDAQGHRLALVPAEALRSWIPSQGSRALSVEQVVGEASGPRWQYLVLRLDLRDGDGGTGVLEGVRLNGLPFEPDQLGGVSVHQFHELLDLLGDRGWELVIATVTPAPGGPEAEAPPGAGAAARESYRITFKRPRAD